MTRLGEWPWFVAWVLLGVGAALATVSLGPLLLLPVLGAGVLMATKHGVGRSTFGLLSGAGVLSLFVAYVQREGPGTTCWTRGTASGCDEHLNPLPWLVVGLVLVVSGVVGFARATAGRRPPQP